MLTYSGKPSGINAPQYINSWYARGTYDGTMSALPG